MIELTVQQRLELSVPELVAIDPRTQETYVLVRREAYEHLKALLALDDYDPEEGAGDINEIMAEDDANDPYLVLQRGIDVSPFFSTDGKPKNKELRRIGASRIRTSINPAL